ncbi:hypothetical protein VTJ49DRAFT_5481 [Mycothermus thermophilus]|uniref:Cyclin domain-containing protein n=1 Tax=Humicola insolens TaxID=85995 RepID=A0ABR3V318_HUMIN
MAHMTNPLATPDQLFQRRSLGALPMELQDMIFFSTQCLTQAAGLLLQLPQSVTAQANVLLARYWLVENMMAHEFSVRFSSSGLSLSPNDEPKKLNGVVLQDVSAATLYLVAKLSSHPVSPRDVAYIYTYLLSSCSAFFHDPSSPPPPPPPPPFGPETTTTTTTTSTPSPSEKNTITPYLSPAAYQSFHARLLHLEGLILAALGFDTHVALPHPLAITYLQALDFFSFHKDGGGSKEAGKKALAARTVAYLNTALLSPQVLYLTHQPPALAVAAVYSAARDVGAKMPECEWWEVFDVEREELGFLVVGMRSVEGWGRKMRGDMKEVMGGRERGMLMRKDVEGELKRRGLMIVGDEVQNGSKMMVDAEEEAAKRLDEKMAEMESG